MIPRTATTTIAAAAALAALFVAAPGAAVAALATSADHRSREVVVHYAPGTSIARRNQIARTSARGTVTTVGLLTRVLRVPPGATVAATAAQLRRRPGVTWAGPNPLARISGNLIPNDPGRGGPAGNWRKIQWNFLSGYGVNAPAAWSNLIAAKHPGGRGAVVAVLDTGVAYRNAGHFRRSPDFVASQFTPGYDFVSNDAYPDDYYGHGTFVAGVIAERTDNRKWLTGLAYGAKIMPVRVLDSHGIGDAATIAKGIRWAARHGAQVINLSLEFDSDTPRSELGDVISAIGYASARGVVVVAAAGNKAESQLAYPSRAPNTISVGATTEHGCIANYSDFGPGIDLVAPGGGADSGSDPDRTRCHPEGPDGRDIYQLTFSGSVRSFGLPSGYIGTSMAAPHVSAVAALVIASGVLGRRPTPAAVQQRLERTARDLGAPGYDRFYGYGLLDAAAATAR